jgi:hypothetical protein
VALWPSHAKRGHQLYCWVPEILYYGELFHYSDESAARHCSAMYVCANATSQESRLLVGGRQLSAAALLWSVKHTINDQTRWYLGYTPCSSRTQPNNINAKNLPLILFCRWQWSEISFYGLLRESAKNILYFTQHYIGLPFSRWSLWQLIIFATSVQLLWCFNL